MSFRDRLPIWIVFLGLALRLYAAISHLDLNHQDEHFQTLEPASHVVFGFGWLSWEWTMGLRSWFVPGLYMPLLWVFKILGFSGGPVPIIGCRVLMAVLSSFTLYQFWILLRDAGFKKSASLIATAAFALSPYCAAWGAMTLSDVWATIFLWCSLPLVLRALKTYKNVFIAGACLGLSFLARIQMVLWPVGIVAVLLFRKPFPKKLIFRFALGYFVVVLFQGALDWVTWGAPFHSTILNIQKNVLENVASFYGTAPFYNYILELPKNVGLTLIGVTIACVGAAFVFRKARFSERDFLIAIPAMIYFLIHSLIAHKEQRFMFPMIPVIFYFLAWGLNAFDWSKFESKKIYAPILAVGSLMIALVSLNFVYSSEHTYPFDLSELTQKIWSDGGLSRGGCLLMVDHYWVWTRGEMMIGAPVHFIEVSASKPFPDEARGCPYAITLPGRESWFMHAGSTHWEVIMKDSHGQLLLKQSGLTKS